MEEIKKYLEGKKRDFDQGLILLRRYSRNRYLIQNIERRHNQEKMEYELRKIADVNPKPVNKPKQNQGTDSPEFPSQQTRETGDQVIEKLVTASINPGQLPEDLKAKYDENTKSYKLLRSLHEKLKLLKDATDADRKPVAEEMIRLDILIRENWNAIDSFLKSPDHPDENPDDQSGSDTGDQHNRAPIDHKQIANNRSYISKNKGKLAELKAQDEKKFNALKAKIQERVTELINAGEVFTDELAGELKKWEIELDGVKAGSGA